MARTLTPEHKAKMQEGRRRTAEVRKAQRLQHAKSRIEAFQAWIKADARYAEAKKYGDELPPKPKAPMMIPSDHDYRLVREASA